jgi:hypothetical protein
MASIFPSPFRVREWVLTVTALVCAVAALLLSNAAGLGAGGVLFLAVLVGTVLFIAISGRQRVFFTALFTSSMSAGLVVWSIVDSVFVRRESLSREQLLLPFMLSLFYILIPVAFAWLVTFVISRLEKVSRHDDHAA